MRLAKRTKLPSTKDTMEVAVARMRRGRPTKAEQKEQGSLLYWKALALQRHDALQQLNRGILRLQAKIDRVRKEAGLRENKLIRALNEAKGQAARIPAGQPTGFQTNNPQEALRFLQHIMQATTEVTRG